MKITTEKKKLIAIIIMMVVLISAPTLYSMIIAPAFMEPSGVRSFIPGDIFVYYSYLEQVRQGNLLLTDLYTTEQSYDFVNVFWQFLGLFSWLGLSNFFIFLLSRALLTGIFVFILYEILRYFTKEIIQTIPLLLFTLFAGGLGPYYLLNNFNAFYQDSPLDIWVPEHNFIIGIVASPHNIASMALLVLVFFFGYKSYKSSPIRNASIAGLLSLFLFQFHPYYIPLVYGVLGTYFLVYVYKNKQQSILNGFYRLGPLIFFSLPSVLYHFYLLQVDEVFLSRAYENVLPLPILSLVFISYSFFLPTAFIGIYKIVKHRNISDKNRFIITWFLVQGMLIFSPITFQRKLMEVWLVPMAILSWIGIEYLLKKLNVKHAYKTFLTPILVVLYLLLTPSSFYNITRDYLIFTNKNYDFATNNILYIHADLIDAYTWLRNTLNEDDIVFSHINSGTLIPAYSGRRVYIGHGSETLYSHISKIPLMILFFDERNNDTKRKKFLQTNEISYLWWGEAEQNAFDFLPEDKPYLSLAFTNDKVQIYRVTVDTIEK